MVSLPSSPHLHLWDTRAGPGLSLVAPRSCPWAHLASLSLSALLQRGLCQHRTASASALPQPGCSPGDKQCLQSLQNAHRGTGCRGRGARMPISEEQQRMGPRDKGDRVALERTRPTCLSCHRTSANRKAGGTVHAVGYRLQAWGAELLRVHREVTPSPQPLVSRARNLSLPGKGHVHCPAWPTERGRDGSQVRVAAKGPARLLLPAHLCHHHEKTTPGPAHRRATRHAVPSPQTREQEQ